MLSSNIRQSILIFFLVGSAPFIQAQDRSTQSPEVQSFFLNPDLKGAGQNSVNLYSGDVNLPINLLSIAGRGGLNTNVSAFYNSNIQNQRDVWALEAPTSILGLGWSMDYERIVVDHKNTGTVHDDDFYLISGGSNNELIMTSSTGATNGVKTFETKNYQFWKITYYKSDERWEIIKEDGITYVYGGGKVLSSDNWNYTSDGNSIQWGVKWGNWIGSSSRTQGQSQHAIAWNLSKVKNIWGDELTYEYLAVEEKVGRFGQPDLVEPKQHTKASYLQKITTPEGKIVEFIYGEKTSDEYTDPHQELTIPYGRYIDVTGESQVIEGEINTWTAVVGNAAPPVSYQWEYQYVGQSGWISEGVNEELTRSFYPFNDIYSLNIRLTVTDANGSQSITKPVTIFRDGSDPDPGCDPDCGPIPVIGSAAGGDPAALPAHYEPDAYQEKYETKFLNRIEVRNEKSMTLYYIDFEYSGYGAPGNPDYKRLLTRITQEYPGGETLPSLDFRYYNSSAVHPAALNKVIYPTGAEVVYKYTEKSITRSNQYINVTGPSGYEEPNVFFESDYVVFTWRNNSDFLKIKIVHWAGEWVEHDFITIPYAGKLLNGDQINFSIKLEQDFFAILSQAKEESNSKSLYIYRKLDWSKSSWYSKNYSLNFTNSKAGIATGKDFVSVVSFEDGTIYRWNWKGNDWIDQPDIQGSRFSDGNGFFIGGTNNYFVLNDIRALDTIHGANNEYYLNVRDRFSIHYLDELNQWNEVPVPYSGSSPATHIDIFDTDNYNSIHPQSSFFGLSAVGTSEYIFRLKEDYNLHDGFSNKSTSDYAPVYTIGNESIMFTPDYHSFSKSPIYYRFDGIYWKEAVLNNVGTRLSIGRDILVYRERGSEHDLLGNILKYNPNNNVWVTESNISDGVTTNYSSAEVGVKHFSFGTKLYYLEPNGENNSLGNLPVHDPLNKILNTATIKFGANFVAYETSKETSPSSYTDDGSDVTIIKNGSEMIGPFNISGKVYDGRMGHLVGSNIIVTEISSGFGVRYVTENQVSGHVKDYPVTEISIDNKYRVLRKAFEYETSTATIDAATESTVYNKVTVMGGGSLDEGETEYYFYNGLKNNQVGGTYPLIDGLDLTAEIENVVKGLSYLVKTYNSSGQVVSTNGNIYETTFKPILKQDGNDQVDIAYYVRKIQTTSILDGVAVSESILYNQNGLQEVSFLKDEDADGNSRTIRQEIKYTEDEYPEIEGLNIKLGQIEKTSKIDDTPLNLIDDYATTSKTVVTWKDWGGDKWAPHKTYIWDGTGSSTFDYSGWSGSLEPPSNWIKTGEITTRDSYGNVIETIDSEGFYSSTIMGFDGTVPTSTFNNAQLSEVRADGFDESGSPANSGLNWYNMNGGTWINEDGVLKASKTGGEAYLHTTNNVNHASSILEFDFRFSDGGATDWLGFQFRLTLNGAFWYDSGYLIKIQKNGALSLSHVTTEIATGNIGGSLEKWHHLRLVSESDGRIKVFIDGELITETISSFSLTSQYFGFIVNNAAVEIDNFRIYPNDATATTIGYDPDYKDMISSSDGDGYLTRIHKDEYRNTIEVVNHDGLVVSAVKQRLSRERDTGTFSISRPNASYSAQFPTGNAVYNSGVEFGAAQTPDYWDVNAGTINREKNQGYTGSYALKYYQSNASGYFEQKLNDPEFLWQGKKYFVRFWVRTSGYVPTAPTITVSLRKNGSVVSATESKMLTSIADWILFEAEISTGGGEYYSWNDLSYSSFIRISSNIPMGFLFDDFYLGKLSYEDESRPQYSVVYSNGSGSPIQSQVWNGNNYTVQHTEYDDLGRVYRSWRPYSYNTNGLYNTSFASRAAAYYGTTGTPSVRLYTENEYFADPLSRIKAVTPVGSGVEKIEYAYSSGTLGSSVLFNKTTVTDLNNISSVTYSNTNGSVVKSIAALNTAHELSSAGVFDPVTRVSESRPPHYFDPPAGSQNTNWISTSKSDFLGRTIEATSPDAGTAKMKYDELGRLRFSQSAEQAYLGKVSFTSYDHFGRPTVSGEAEADFALLDGDQTEAFESSDYEKIQVSAYDELPSSAAFPWSLFSSQISGITAQNPYKTLVAEVYKTNGMSGSLMQLGNGTVTTNMGTKASPGAITVDGTYSVEPGGTIELQSGDRVVLKSGFHAKEGSNFNARIDAGMASGTANNEEWQATYYSYDFEGRVVKKWILTQDKPELRTELGYTYNDAGQITRQHTKIGTTQHFYHFYTYDELGRLKEVYVNTSSGRPVTPLARYTYDAEGKVLEKDIVNLSEANVYYSYDSQSRLTRINTTDSLFNERITYNEDGTIKKTDFINEGVGPDTYSYTYTYDVLGRMTDANYSFPLDLPPHNGYDVRNVNYDKHGNIQGLDRYRDQSNLVDDLVYNYIDGTNKLSAVADAVHTTSSIDWDAEDESFIYNFDGNVVSTSKDGGGGFDQITYGTSNLPAKVRLDNAIEALYRYNSSGWRFSKKVTDTQTSTVTEEEYYIMDGGTVLAITNASGNVQHWNMYGNELIGRQEANGYQKFYVTDHLGSTRQVIEDQAGQIIENYDYYPFGLILRSYIYQDGTKEGFTGKELDEESGQYYFGARYYNAALGRWSVTDPARQLDTPYGYAGNPVSYVDPDGQILIPFLAAGIVMYNASQTYKASGGDWVYTLARTTIGLGRAYVYSGVAQGLGSNVTTGQYIVNQQINSYLPQQEINVTNNLSINASPAFFISPDGLALGANVGASYTSGNFSGSAGFGFNNFGYMANARASYYGFSYGQTYYGGGESDPNGAYGNQRVGAVSYRSKHFSVRWENDGWALSGDRWRTNAMELNYRGYIVGTTLNTNDPENAGSTADNRESKKWGKNNLPYGSWKNGKVFRTPLYFGFQQGHKVTRIGYSHAKVQDFIQNGWHKHAPVKRLRTHFFIDYQVETTDPYYYYGFYNPYSLYFR